MSCNKIISSETIYGCAEFCEKWNKLPIPKFKLGPKNSLIQDCQFFDTGVIQNRQYKWIISTVDHIIIEFGYGSSNTLISAFNNGSTFSSLRLGFNNLSLVNYLNSLSTVKIKSSDPIYISLKVKDCDGFESAIESNKYKFNSI